MATSGQYVRRLYCTSAGKESEYPYMGTHSTGSMLSTPSVYNKRPPPSFTAVHRMKTGYRPPPLRRAAVSSCTVLQFHAVKPSRTNSLRSDKPWTVGYAKRLSATICNACTLTITLACLTLLTLSERQAGRGRLSLRVLQDA